MVSEPAVQTPLEDAAQDAPPAEPAEEPTPVEEPQAPEPVEASPKEGEPEDSSAALKELFKGATVKELRAALDEVPEDIRAELEQEIERRVEQRVKTRDKEVSKATETRTKVYAEFKAQGEQAERYLVGRIQAAQRGDEDALSDVRTLATAIESYRQGGIAAVAEANEQAVTPILDQYLPDMTEAERETLDKPLYQFGRTGDISKLLPALMELVTQRYESQGLQKGIQQAKERDESRLTLAEKAQQLMEVKKQAAGVRVNGAAPSAEATRAKIARMEQELKKDINAGKVAPQEYREKRKPIDELIASLPKE